MKHTHTHTLLPSEASEGHAPLPPQHGVSLALSSSLSTFSSYCVWIFPLSRSLSLCISSLSSLLPSLSSVVLSHLSTYKYSHLCQTPSFTSPHRLSLSLQLALPLSSLLLPLMFLSLTHFNSLHTQPGEREGERHQERAEMGEYTWCTLPLSTHPDEAEKPAETLSDSNLSYIINGGKWTNTRRFTGFSVM